MSDTALATTDKPTRQSLAVEGRSRALKVTGKLKAAIDFLVWQGGKTDLQDAANHAGMTTHSVRCALEKPHVKAYYNAQIEVLRSGQRARNIHRAIEIREAAPNMPAIHAIRYLDGEDAENARQLNAMQRAPGLTVVVIGGAPQGMTIDADVTEKGAASD